MCFPNFLLDGRHSLIYVVSKASYRTQYGMSSVDLLIFIVNDAYHITTGAARRASGNAGQRWRFTYMLMMRQQGRSANELYARMYAGLGAHTRCVDGQKLLVADGQSKQVAAAGYLPLGRRSTGVAPK